MEGREGVSASSYDNAEKFESLNGRNLTSIALLSFIQLRSMKSENAMQRNGKGNVVSYDIDWIAESELLSN